MYRQVTRLHRQTRPSSNTFAVAHPCFGREGFAGPVRGGDARQRRIQAPDVHQHASDHVQLPLPGHARGRWRSCNLWKEAQKVIRRPCLFDLQHCSCGKKAKRDVMGLRCSSMFAVLCLPYEKRNMRREEIAAKSNRLQQIGIKRWLSFSFLFFSLLFGGITTPQTDQILCAMTKERIQEESWRHESSSSNNNNNQSPRFGIYQVDDMKHIWSTITQLFSKKSTIRELGFPTSTTSFHQFFYSCIYDWEIVLSFLYINLRCFWESFTVLIWGFMSH